MGEDVFWVCALVILLFLGWALGSEEGCYDSCAEVFCFASCHCVRWMKVCGVVVTYYE